MANKSLFQSLRGRLARRTDAINHEGAPAYARTAEQALAQYAATGCLQGTFYAGADTQLEELLRLAGAVDADFLARTAVHARTRGHMKDAPALLLAVLATRDGARFEQVFDRVVDGGRMLRTFVQILRSGVTGRRSLGSRPRRCVRRWLDRAPDAEILRAAVGRDPSLADIVKMVHPTPTDPARSALYRWLIGKPWTLEELPLPVQRFERWKAAVRAGEAAGEPPDVPFRLLTGLPLGRSAWTAIARRTRWHATRMNLNTFQRHGVFADDEVGHEMVRSVAERLGDPAVIRKARVFPYQLLAAYRHASPALPAAIRDALHTALEHATRNVPALPAHVVVCPDVSGSMQWPVTGYRPGASSAVRCVDVAALVAACILRRQPRARILPFEHRVIDVRLEPRDTVLTNADRLAAVGGGGTALAAPLQRLATARAPVDLVIVVSDNESWSDHAYGGGWRATPAMAAWAKIQRNNPDAKLVCIDLQPSGTTQTHERPDILNIGGFSDVVFELIADFAAGRMAPDHWIDVIGAVDLEPVPA